MKKKNAESMHDKVMEVIDQIGKAYDNLPSQEAKNLVASVVAVIGIGILMFMPFVCCDLSPSPEEQQRLHDERMERFIHTQVHGKTWWDQ